MGKEAPYCVQETHVSNHENKPPFASVPVLDRIRASLSGSVIRTSTDNRPKLDQIDEVSCVRKAYSLQFGNRPKRIRSRVHGDLMSSI